MPEYRYTIESLTDIGKLRNLSPDSIERSEMELGIRNNEPIMIMADSLMRYAASIKDGVDWDVVEAISEIAKSISILNRYRGAVANEKNLNIDSKSGSVVEWILEAACAKIGIDYNKLS